MAIADPKNPDTAVRVQSGDTLSAIAKANGLTTKALLALNPQLTSNPKYNGGSTIFSNTKINIAAPSPKADAGSISSGFVSDAANTARIAATSSKRRCSKSANRRSGKSRSRC